MAPLSLSLPNGEVLILETSNRMNVVNYHGKKWDQNCLFSLIKECPELQRNAAILSQIVYHLALFAEDFQPIDDIKRFQNWYQERVIQDQKAGVLVTNRINLSQMGICQVAEMHDPEIRGRTLEFFVASAANIPNVVRVPLDGSRISCSPFVRSALSEHAAE